MHGGEKQLEVSIEAIETKLTELKNQLYALLYKLENEAYTFTWPSILDSFALISAQFTAISKNLSIGKTPQLHNFTVLPLLLSHERDEELFQLTERRISAFSHDLVPDYLRSKPEPDIETKIHQYLTRASGIAYETASKQSGAFNKVLSHVLRTINKSREENENEAASRSGIRQTSSSSDTHLLVSTISLGKGLKHKVSEAPSLSNMFVSTGIRPGGTGPGSEPSSSAGGQNSHTNPNQVPLGMMGK